MKKYLRQETVDCQQTDYSARKIEMISTDKFIFFNLDEAFELLKKIEIVLRDCIQKHIMLLFISANEICLRKNAVEESILILNCAWR